MAVWEELRLTLARLLEDRSGAVTSYPDLAGSNGGTPPYPIGLAPWAEAVARELHGRFGDQVDLTVGALPYRRAGRPGDRGLPVSPPPCSIPQKPRPSWTARPWSVPGTRCGTGCWSATGPGPSWRSRRMARSRPLSWIRGRTRWWAATPGSRPSRSSCSGCCRAEPSGSRC